MIYVLGREITGIVSNNLHNAHNVQGTYTQKPPVGDLLYPRCVPSDTETKRRETSHYVPNYIHSSNPPPWERSPASSSSN